MFCVCPKLEMFCFFFIGFYVKKLWSRIRWLSNLSKPVATVLEDSDLKGKSSFTTSTLTHSTHAHTLTTLTLVTACRNACWPNCCRCLVTATSIFRLSCSMRRLFSSNFSRILFSCAAMAWPPSGVEASSVRSSPSEIVEVISII